MDSNFEQQFTQNIKSTPIQPVQSPDSGGSSKLPWIVVSILAGIVLIESIVFVITASNYFTLASEDEYTESELEAEEYTDPNYIYDDNGLLVAFNETCRNSDDSYYKFTTNKNYQYFDSSANPVSSGTYDLERESVIFLSGAPNKTLFYVGNYIVDGNITYECDNIEDTESE